MFAAATDLTAWPRQISAISAVEVVTDDPVGEGTVFKETTVMFNREHTETMTITAFDPPHKLVLEADSCGARIVTTQRFLPDGDGTLMELDMHSAGGGFMGCLMAPMGWLMKGAMKKMMAKDFEELACAMREAH